MIELKLTPVTKIEGWGQESEPYLYPPAQYVGTAYSLYQKKITATNNFSVNVGFSVIAKDPKNITPHELMAFYAQQGLLEALKWNGTSYDSIHLVQKLDIDEDCLRFRLITHHDHGATWMAPLIFDNSRDNPFFSEFTSPGMNWGYVTETRIGMLRNRFNIKSPHSRWKKFHKLPALSESQRHEIAIHVASRAWVLCDEKYRMVFNDKYKTRYDFDNIAAYIVTDKSIREKDVIPIPQESYFDLLVDIDKVFKAMGLMFSPASGALMRMERNTLEVVKEG
jgi:hypothetical protein